MQGPLPSAHVSDSSSTVRSMSTDISMQTTQLGGGPDGRQAHWLPGDRPTELPISAAVWDVAKSYGKQSEAVVVALYEAVKKLEAAQQGGQP